MVCEISLRRVTCLCVVKTLTPGHMQSVVKEFPKRVLSFRPKKALALSSIHEGTHFADLHWHQPLGQRRVGRTYPSYRWGSIPVGIASLCILCEHWRKCLRRPGVTEINNSPTFEISVWTFIRWNEVMQMAAGGIVCFK